MTTNNTINAGLMTAFGLLVAALVPAFAINLWYGLADTIVIVAVAVAYELLPIK